MTAYQIAIRGRHVPARLMFMSLLIYSYGHLPWEVLRGLVALGIVSLSPRRPAHTLPFIVDLFVLQFDTRLIYFILLRIMCERHKNCAR